jgi:diacylglycerol kinase
MEREQFSIQKRIRSFHYAFSGLRLIFKTEHNAWIHMAATITVLALAVALKVSATEGALLAIAVGMVWITEFINTCIEKTMDFISTEHHPSIRLIKDLSAGAVLVAAIISVVIGCLVFIPKFI